MDAATYLENTIHDENVSGEAKNICTIALEHLRNTYVKLPVDVYGQPIHIGDRLTDGQFTFVVENLSLSDCGEWEIQSTHRQWFLPEFCRHGDTTKTEKMLWELLEKIKPEMTEDEAATIVKQFVDAIDTQINDKPSTD